ncbi:MAG: GMC family oxidoreductase N-terminal domain-containing protein [Candidatus Kariarchaeaceae archaeon]|jgi:choline dehydrogenase-like flavoprotein
MIVQPFDYQGPSSLDTDILIIGSGCGGAIAAAKLSEKGYKIILVEEGAFVSQKIFDQNPRKLIPKMYRRGAGLATDDMSIRILLGSTFGGSATINWMTCLRTPDFVLDQWSDQFGLVDYGPSKMKPYFAQVEKRLSVHKINDKDHSKLNRIILDGSKELGIHGEASNNNSIDCIGCGTCGLGCPYNAKQDMRLTYLRDSLKNGIMVHTSTKAEKIRYENKNKQLTTVTMKGKDWNIPDKTLSITSKKVIVAASAIHTPLLLQKSGLTKGKLVGKHLQLHPVATSVGEYGDYIEPTYGIPQTTTSEEYHDLDGNGYGFWLEVPDLEPFLIGVNYPAIGKLRRQKMKDIRKAGVIIILTRDGANGKSAISNGEVRWRRGFNYQNGSFSLRPIPSIRYKLSKEDKYHLMKGLENSIEMHFAAGAKKVNTLHNEFTELKKPEEAKRIWDLRNGPNEMSLFSAHPTGTTRMGVDPKLSVVDKTCEMHHYPGVYVMDGSVIPTAPGVNPMITILATISRAIDLGSL